MTDTTGMSMSGKMSVGVRAIVSGPMPRIRSARTTKVYGRSRATRTIHMRHPILTQAPGIAARCVQTSPLRAISTRHLFSFSFQLAGLIAQRRDARGVVVARGGLLDLRARLVQLRLRQLD